MAKLHQLQWRTTPDGVWKFHSLVEEIVASEQMALYNSREWRTFDYRVVPKDSPEALEPIQVSQYLGRLEQLPPAFR